METKIRPLLDHPLIEFIGELGDTDKAAFLGDALALLFPIDWVEPFGLVMIEAMACGTPIVAFRRGSVPEIVDDGVTGFVVDNIDQALAALERITRIDRARCRQVFETRFTAERMAADYLRVYQRLIDDTGRVRSRLPRRRAPLRRKLVAEIGAEATRAAISAKTKPESQR